MIAYSEESCCRSAETSNYGPHVDTNNHKIKREHTRYKIVLYEKGVLAKSNRKLLQRISLLDLSGDVTLNSKGESNHIQGPSKHIINSNRENTFQKSQGQEKISINAQIGRGSFKRKISDIKPDDSDNHTSTDNFNVWGKLSGALNSICDFHKDDNENKTHCDIYLTIGGYILRGKPANTRDGEHLLIMRKVPNHCSCLCSCRNHIEVPDHTTHPSYYEICGIINKKVDFKERPSVVYQTLDDSLPDEAYLYPSKNSQSKWIILTVTDELLNDIIDENAYFKEVRSHKGKNEVKKVVLCARNETFYIEKMELGGTILLVASADTNFERKDRKNLLTIVGSCKYMYNLIRATPIFDSLPKDQLTSTSLMTDKTAISDSQIMQFLLNKYEESPCYYIYQTDNKIRYMGEHFFGEVAIRLLQIIPIYFTKNPQHKKALTELTVGYFWNIVNEYSDIFEFIESELMNIPTILQLLTRICDFDEQFDLKEYVSVMKDETQLLNLTAKLNLFKIQKLITWCITTASHDTGVNFIDMVFHIDNIIFNDSLPGYIFDELLKYLMEYNCKDNSTLDYINCVKFYYENTTFSDLTEKIHSYCGIESIDDRLGTLYDKSGPELFKINRIISSKVPNLEKIPCLDYDIFKGNTRGLAQLRFNYSMNSLLSVCRSPLSIHISCLANKLVTAIEPNGCLLRICQTQEDEDLRDSLSALFKVRDVWHLEDLECKLKRFFKEKTAIDAITGAPNHYARLWIKSEKNNKNTERNKDSSIWEKDSESKKQIEEESYMIINWNVPLL
ncbi:hypothetical protein BEWA_021860 [Theileria equi strain WA]|uniref:Uncharacterized protein n=1 Tax=Theileria equi strain WA TaxID=1537102 RepID=L0AVS3_THEEQ|nr:hypothetical protein BEWA_021860 [Theileria equi strain WA]AFZ79338.1 hypothetical protein BEWA_021860 [Theileria equi strain WA]|eukprot:XP_004829004.1 hypothetical protein BEWA_021860 [Theileria equi strain WA]